MSVKEEECMKLRESIRELRVRKEQIEKSFKGEESKLMAVKNNTIAK